MIRDWSGFFIVNIKSVSTHNELYQIFQICVIREIEKFEIPGEVLGRWTRIIPNPEDEITNSHETITSAEDFFFSLFEAITIDIPFFPALAVLPDLCT